eukprot:8377716-Alexandrium_andersonii.AAC.1
MARRPRGRPAPLHRCSPRPCRGPPPDGHHDTGERTPAGQLGAPLRDSPSCNVQKHPRHRAAPFGRSGVVAMSPSRRAACRI